jgi:PAS domain S-box-containing protein
VLDTTDAPRPVFTSAAAPGSHDSTTKSLGAYAEGITLAQRHWLVIVSPGAAARCAARQRLWPLARRRAAAHPAGHRHPAHRAEPRRRRAPPGGRKTQALAEANDALGRYIGALADANRRLASEVDEHARAESQLRETTSLQRAILDCAEYAVIYTDAKGTIRVINPAAERLFGYRADELIDKATPQILHPDEHAPAGRSKASTIGLISLPGAESHTAEFDMRRRDGSLFPASLSVSIVRDTLGQIRGYLGIIADITQRVDAESRIRHLAHYDNLTSLPNRSLLNRHLADVLAAARARHRRVAVLVTDLDHFKYVNDTLGHLAGDQLLLAVAQRLRTGVRDGDLVARTGGDEFVIVLADLDETYLPEDAGERLLASVARPSSWPATSSPSP